MLRRIALAFACFFRVLLGRPLPPRVLELGLAPLAPTPAPAALPERAERAEATPGAAESGAIAVLALLQRDGRLIDFLEEDISDYADEKIGAAVREVHRGCRKALAEHVALEPVLEGEEGGPVRVEAGFDPNAIRLTGAVSGKPPFSGTLRHPGWRAARLDLRPAPDRVIAPAEVEL